MHSLKQMNHKTISIDVEKAKKKKKKNQPQNMFIEYKLHP